MIFKILLSYICGYVNISVEGYFIERFINMCISKRILLWNTKREKSTYLQTNISIKDFKRIKEIAKKTKCRATINRKKGLPFILNRYKKRKIFIVALILITTSILMTSRYIWNIEIQGNERIETEEILAQLNEKGIIIGAKKSKIDTEEIIRQIRLKRDDIAWMSIDLNGTNAIIKIVENTGKPEIVNKNDYCNIVSNKSGVITKINAKSGTPVVKVGDVVTKDTILVGRMDGRKIYRNKIYSQ